MDQIDPACDMGLRAVSSKLLASSPAQVTHEKDRSSFDRGHTPPDSVYFAPLSISSRVWVPNRAQCALRIALHRQRTPSGQLARFTI
jgi:hypothetical protein